MCVKYCTVSCWAHIKTQKTSVHTACERMFQQRQNTDFLNCLLSNKYSCRVNMVNDLTTPYVMRNHRCLMRQFFQFWKVVSHPDISTRTVYTSALTVLILPSVARIHGHKVLVLCNKSVGLRIFRR